MKAKYNEENIETLLKSLKHNEVMPESSFTANVMQRIKDDSSFDDDIINLDKGNFDENKGSLPFFTTTFLYPTYSYYRNTSKFRVSDICTACKKCEKVCPLNVIEIIDNKPVWKLKKCTLCFACLHICPAQAINYGKVLFFFDSKNKGRYRNPYAPKGY